MKKAGHSILPYVSYFIAVSRTRWVRLYLVLFLFAGICFEMKAQDESCDDCIPRLAVKTNLLHDIVLTPDLGVELCLAKKYSLSLEGIYAWWSNDSRHRYWRIRGGTLEMRFWFGERRKERSMTGHHIGVYGSIHDYDFEFGGKGWQSPDITYGAGIEYGFSIPLSTRLNLDFSINAGYSGGTIIKYRYECGEYVSTERKFRKYIGVTGLGVTLIWFPGKGHKNRPDFGL